MEINAKRLILGLLVASDSRELSTVQLLAGCGLFGITGNSVRVTLTRLAAEGKVESAGRGRYRLGRAATGLGDEVGAWRKAESRVVEWSGAFLVAFTGNLGRRDRVQLRRRERALEMLGFRVLERGMHVRPDNLDQGARGTRLRLVSLGLDRRCPMFCARDFGDELERRLDSLWDGDALNTHYSREREQLEEWMRHAEQLEPDVAARESYLLGSEAIRSLVFDPWLPAPFVDVKARHDFFEAVCRFDDLGKVLWSSFAQEGSHVPRRQTVFVPQHH